MGRDRITNPLEPRPRGHAYGAGQRALDIAGWLTAAAAVLFLLSTGCSNKNVPCAGGCPKDRPICGGVSCIECSVEADCKDGETCNADGECEQVPCGSDTCAGACPPGAVCRPRFLACVCQLPDPQCTADTNCPSGDTCVAGKCETLCSTDDNCVGATKGPLCDVNRHCVQCRGDADCFSQGSCSGGQCKKCFTDADCHDPFPFCHPIFFLCRPCLVDSHCQAGQHCEDGFCEHRFAQNPSFTFALSNNTAGATPGITASASFGKNELELYTLAFRVVGVFTFNGFGPPNTQVGLIELDFNNDGHPDRSAAIRSKDGDSAYVDINANGAFDMGEVTIGGPSAVGGTLNVTVPDGGDGNAATVVTPFGGRLTITIFPGPFTNPVLPGTFLMLGQVASVDPNTDGANDNQNSPPISFNDANILVVIDGRCGNGTVDPGEDCEPGSTGESGDCDGDCTSPVCGDRVRNSTAGEQCDNGATCSDGTPCTFRRNCRGIGDEECSQRDGDGCSNTCQLELAGAVCGNGRLEGDEACDDGNTISADGCSAACIVEMGYDCAAAQPSVCTPICGDGISVGDELCDGSVTNRECCSSTCAFQYSGAPCGDSTNNACNRPDTCNGAGTCRANFAINGTACDDASAETKNDQCLDGVCTGAGPDCGNGAVGGGEECDDGNGLNGDGCSGLCRAEAGYNCTGHPSVCVLMSRKPGDANCDGQRGAADLVQFVILIARGDRAPCRQDDLTGDRRVAADDLTAYIPLIFGAP